MNYFKQDERVVEQKRKITSEAFSFVMMFLLGAALVKQLVYEAPFEDYAVEFIAFFGGAFYIVIKNLFVGNRIFTTNKNNLVMIVVNSIIIGITITVITLLLHYNENNSFEGITVTVILAFVVPALSAFIVLFGLNKLNQHRIKKLENQYDDENEA